MRLDKHHHSFPSHKYLPPFPVPAHHICALQSSKLLQIYSNFTQTNLHVHTINMSNRALPALGAIAAGGVGYYLYTAGGDPKLAEKKAERKLYSLECIGLF
jgi:hypothetical protein